MSENAKKLFNFSRTLPPPFDTLSGKKVNVSSKYGDGTTSTLCCTVIKGVLAVCGCMQGSEQGATGFIDHKTVAEYKSSSGADLYHLVVYDQTSGAFLASVYDKSTETLETYSIGNNARDGAAFIMAMFPVLMEDEEFSDNYYSFFDEFSNGYVDMTKATAAMGMLCDNVYRRVMDPSCPAKVNVTLDKSGNVTRVSQAQLDAGAFIPTNVVAGEFSIFAKTGATRIKKAAKIVELSDFVGKYEIHSRCFTEQEQSLIPKLPEWFIVSQDAIDICTHIKETTGKPTQMRNFLLRGPAGTGKTKCAEAIAAGINLPYMKYTCSSGTEIFDFIGMIFPDTDAGTTGNEQLDQENALLNSMGGLNYENISKIMGIPDLDDMDYDPAGVYYKCTGIEKPDATNQDCMKVVLDKVTEKIRALSKRDQSSEKSTGQTFNYVETDFIKALKNGYVIEIQEPSTIVQPGVLVGLNSLLEQSGSITLPTGEVIERHPDTVVIVTTNTTYEGCRGMNQSVVDRMNMVYDIENPSPEFMVQRAMSITGETDDYIVSQMVQVVNNISDYCRKNGITDGTCGMRSLIDWISSYQVTGDPYESAIRTIISKSTSDEIDREALISSILEPIFAPKNVKKAI